MKKQLLLLAMILLPLVASALDIDVQNADGVTIYYNYINNGTELEVTYFYYSNNYQGNVAIPEEVTYNNRTRKVTSIGERAFYGCSGLTSVTIPNSVTSIGEEAFDGCYGLKKVIVKDIAAWCGIKFDGYYSNPLYYAKHIYSDEDTEITNLIIPNSVTSIGERAFAGCSGLTSITIPNSVTSIGAYAFYYCSGLTSVTIGSGVTSIGSYAFQYCSGLTSVTVEKGNKVYDSRDNCNAIIATATNTLLYGSNTTIIPNSVTSIGGYAFYGCSGLTSVTIGNSVTSIGERAFAGCSGLTSVTIPNSVTSIGGYAFAGCSGLTSTTIGNSVTSIGAGAFYKCSGLTSITIPNSVASIGNEAFYDCQELKKISIGNGIQTINSKAFANCPKINDVYCYKVRYPTTQSDAFKNSYPDYIALHVPEESVVQYGAVEPWVHFKKVVALSESDYNEGSEGSDEEGTEKCFKPTISYQNGKLTFNCDTEGAICQYAITDDDIKSGAGNEVQLDVTYRISVYATKSGYKNSETATATLCWIDQQPKTEGITNGIANIPAQAVLIQSNGGVLTIQGLDDGTQISVYSINGTEAGKAISRNGCAMVNTNLQAGSVAIVKIGEKSVKVVVK